jgi:hypothetical protein
VKNINWNTEKSLALKESRGICFEDVVFHIEKGDILDDYQPTSINMPGSE